MRISAKGRYALAAITEIARLGDREGNVSVLSLATSLGISKIYLEQVLVQLKKSGVILSTKGPKGGYQLARPAAKINAWEILYSVENTLVEGAEATVAESDPALEMALNKLVFQRLDGAVRSCLEGVTVQELVDYAGQQRQDQSFMLNL